MYHFESNQSRQQLIDALMRESKAKGMYCAVSLGQIIIRSPHLVFGGRVPVNFQPSLILKIKDAEQGGTLIDGTIDTPLLYYIFMAVLSTLFFVLYMAGVSPQNGFAVTAVTGLIGIALFWLMLLLMHKIASIAFKKDSVIALSFVKSIL